MHCGRIEGRASVGRPAEGNSAQCSERPTQREGHVAGGGRARPVVQLVCHGSYQSAGLSFSTALREPSRAKPRRSCPMVYRADGLR